MPSQKGHHSISDAIKVSQKVTGEIRYHCGSIAVCGSIRRMQPIVGDVDIIVANVEQPGFMLALARLGNVSGGSVKLTFMCDGISVDVNIVESKGWGAAMMHATGSVQENIRMRAIAKRQGLILNQYGLFTSAGIFVAGATEEEVYERLGVPFKQPKDRN